jgi:hypothetical protein
MTQTMARRTTRQPESFDELLRKHAQEGESLSETILRLVESGALEDDRATWPDWIGSFEGPGDLSVNVEKYLGIKPWGPGEKPGEWPSDKDPG